jgi:Uma2 family endonuclease
MKSDLFAAAELKMNEIVNLTRQRPTTRAADGLPRWRWTVEEVEHLAAAGVFRDDDRFELLGGEIVPRSPKGRRHEIIRVRLGHRFARQAPEDIFVAAVPQFNLTDDTFLVPDLLVHPSRIDTPDVQGTDALLVVEVAETSLACDLQTKMPRYAAHGVQEYWVIDAATLMTTVHREPSGDAYSYVREIASNMPLVSLRVPTLTVVLDALMRG